MPAPQTTPPQCAKCNRPLEAWTQRGSRPLTEHTSPWGKFVCNHPTCERFGLVVKIDPPLARDAKSA